MVLPPMVIFPWWISRDSTALATPITSTPLWEANFLSSVEIRDESGSSTGDGFVYYMEAVSESGSSYTLGVTKDAQTGSTKIAVTMTREDIREDDAAAYEYLSHILEGLFPANALYVPGFPYSEGGIDVTKDGNKVTFILEP